ncbi:MAG: type II secretion system protein GspM [Gammaproteobacteria bacterium]
MKDRIEKIRERIDALSLRERGLLLLSVVFVLYSVWNGVLMGPLTIRHQQLQTQLKQLRTTLATLSEQTGELSAHQRNDPDAAVRTKLTALQNEMAVLDQRIAARTQGLIDPVNMAKMLQDVLKSEPGLGMVSVANLPARPLLDTEAPTATKPDAAVTAGVPGIYRHGMTVTFDGNYLDALHYLRRLEALPWHFYWDSVQFEVVKYPQARFTIVVHTIGLREGWIGV